MQYYVNTNELKKSIDALKNDFLVYYPIKANSNPRLVAFFDGIVDGYEADSLVHISRLIRMHKVAPERILYSYPLKSRQEMRFALRWGIKKFVVDDIKECNDLLELATTPIQILLRVDVSSFIKCRDIVVKWGFDLQGLKETELLIKKSIHIMAGYSFYLPQEINDMHNFEAIVDGLFNEMHAGNYHYFDIGGGFSEELLPQIRSKLQDLTRDCHTKVIIEQGQHLLNPAIDLYVKVLEVRYKNDKKLVFIDSGIYHGLMDVVLKKSSFKIQEETAEKSEPCLVCGDSSDVSDIIGEYHLPCCIKRGDVLRIKGCGAYCEELITPFSKKKKPTIWLA